MPPARFSFYVDGFNLYHAIADDPKLRRCKWLNYAALAREHLPPGANLGDVYYFTAYADWDPDKKSRHKDLILAQRIEPSVQVVLGRFKNKSRPCWRDQKACWSREEKQTDINIAIQLLTDAVQNKYDTAIVISGDTDLVPAVTRVRQLFPEKKVGVLLPMGRKAKELEQVASFTLKLWPQKLKKCRLPDLVHVPSELSTVQVCCPESWR